MLIILNFTQTEKDDESLPDNIFSSVSFVDLLYQYLYYCFIWAAFCLNGPILYNTRWNNGCIEKGDLNKYYIKIYLQILIFFVKLSALKKE